MDPMVSLITTALPYYHVTTPFGHCLRRLHLQVNMFYSSQSLTMSCNNWITNDLVFNQQNVVENMDGCV